MKKSLFILPLLSSLLLIGCKNKESISETLVIFNVEDYISIDDGEGCTDLVKKFEDEYYDKYHKRIKVDYQTYDTNETMYNQFNLQKLGTYDLVMGSEYIIQKMVKEDLVEKYDDFSTNIPNYSNNASTVLRDKLRGMIITKNDGTVVNLDQYTVGYMWGTLGIVYNPEHVDEIDATSWDAFYNPKYKDKASLKNSVRDAFDVGLVHSYYHLDNEFKQAQELYLEYLVDKDETKAIAFNNKLQQVFDFRQVFERDYLNNEDYLTAKSSADLENARKIEQVKQDLITLKQNLFGFETDSGKTDMIEGSKIWMDLAYSGDALFSIYQASELENPKVLKYSVPLEGSNIWYDGWMLSKNAQHKDLAYKFLDFLSDSYNASLNMEYIGYTPFIVGDDVFTYTASSYGASEYDENIEYKDYEDCYYIKDNVLYQVEYIYEDEEDEDPEIVINNCQYDENIDYYEGDMVSIISGDSYKIYNCVQDNTKIDDFEEVLPYDLSNIYGDTLESRNAIIYPCLGKENQLETQYPSKEVIYRCAVMNDTGVYNDQVVIMWGQVKAYTDMKPVYIILSVSLGITLTTLAAFAINKISSSRYKRNKNKENN